MSFGGEILRQAREVLDARDGLLKRAIVSLAAIVVLAALLEVFLFNINFFRTMSYDEVDLSDRLGLALDDDGSYRLSEANHAMTFADLDIPVHNIHIDFDGSQPAQLLTLKIMFTDEAHQTFFDTTEYTVGVPEVDVSTVVSESEYIHLNASGNVGTLTIDLVGDDVSYPIALESLTVNAPEPFNFNTLRFSIVALVMTLCWLFRPKSRIYQISMVDEPLFTKRAIIAAVVVEVLVVSSFLFMGSNLVGVASKSYNYGSWDRDSVVNVFDVGGENAQQYAMLAQAMAKGQLYLDEQPPEWLVEMEDPYDKGLRDEARKAGGEDYLFDAAYYDGHYYVYFGVVPVLMFYLPFYLVTGQNFPTAIGVLIALVAFILGCTALLDRFARYHFKRVSLGIYLLLQIPLVMCSGALYLAKFPTFYSLPIMCALALSAWGLYLWMRGRASERPEGWYLAGSLCMALVVGCRPQLLVLSCVAFPLFWRRYITKRRLFTPEGAREFACLIGPYFVVAAGIMWYNWARFGSPTNFGANYNLTVHDMPKRGFALGRIATALFAFFIQPPTVDGTFPFLLPAVFDTSYMGQTVREVTFGGVFACLPILWIIPFAQPLLRRRFEQRSTKTIAG
ncbi:MAG: cytochrome C oxidase Cbb3, partial [Eggerthellaceae bacterium]|nr:cytochrome C oxidase Cbb3 [Eggerthellaceae bacterium]